MAELNRNETNGEPVRQEGEPVESFMAELNRNETNGEPVRQEGEPAESLETARPVGEPAELLNPARPEGQPADLTNLARHGHPLSLYHDLPPYTCSGCKERGNRVGYKCNGADSAGCGDFSLQLHKDCAELLDTYDYPFRSECRLKFRAKTRGRHHCNACHTLLRGYVFESENRDLRIHPMCMTLPETLQITAHPDHQLKLLARDERIPYTCFACHKAFKSGGWRYRCTEKSCRINVDVSCAKTDIHRLPDCDPDIVESTTCGCACIPSPVKTSFTWLSNVMASGLLESVGSILFESISNCCCHNDEANGGG